MSAVQNAIEHWKHVAPLLTMPASEADYDQLTRALDDVLDLAADDEGHPLAGLASRMGDIIAAYDEQRRPMPSGTGAEALRYLMREHELSASDLPEVGPQAVVAEILNGRRRFNVRQIAVLADRFGVPEAVFIDRARRATRRSAGRMSAERVKKLFRRRKKVIRRPVSRHRQSA